ncbi:MAG: flagellar hook-length control protein FliK [Candidatus Gastranaerophilales bacterium]|nr:flagellar hook-length control protein FliK [Candidatus Gastranaerophilales bacterium]
MINALAQNIQTNENSAAIDVMMQTLSSASQTKTQEEGGFSNIINNLDARTQKAQSDFDKQAKVTNISSINKKALDKKEANNTKPVQKTAQETSVSSKEIVEKAPKKVSTKEANKINTEVEKNTSKINDKALQTSQKEVETKDVETVQTTQTKDLSDINNSSPVESSPVFSSDKQIEINDEQKEQIESALEEIELNIQDIFNVVNIVDETSTIENQDLKTKIDALLQDIENSQDLTKAIEEISAYLDNSSLNQEQKEEITSLLNDLKETLNNDVEIKSDVSQFQNLVDELKKEIDKTLNVDLKTEIKAEVEKPVFENKENIEIVEQKPQKQQEATKIEQKPELKTQEVKEKLNEIVEFFEKNSEDIKKVFNIKEIENLQDVKEVIESIDVDKLGEIKDALKELTNKIDTELKDFSQDLKLDEKLIKPIKNLQETIEKIEADFESENLTLKEDVDFIQKEDVIQTLDKLTSKDFEKIEIQDKEAMKEVVKLLENLDKQLNNKIVDEEVKVQVKDLVEKINDETLNLKDLAEAVDVLADDIKSQFEKQETISLNENNTIDITGEFAKISKNQNDSLNQEKTFENKDSNEFLAQEEETPDVDFADLMDSDFSFEEVKLQGTAQKNIDVKNIEQNLQKTIAMQEMLDEMMVEVDIKTIPSQSGALSVADEITKMAMGETNSLNSITSAGSVTYDSTGVNAVIKNAATLMKSAQVQNPNAPSMEDVLSQVANKITQLKDGSAQKLTMVLRPNDLGRLSIELTSNQQGLTTQIMAQNEDVRAYIERNIDSLRQQLSDAGVNVNSIQIKTAGQEGSTSYEGNQAFNKESQEENLNQQNNKNSKEQQQKNGNKDASEILAQMSNYDMHFAKDFSSVLNKTLSYNIN